MRTMLQRSLFAVLTITMAACTSVDDTPPGDGGSGGTAGTGGSGGTSGTGGTGGIGGSMPAPTVTLTATPRAVATSSTTALSWTATNADSCTASNGWEDTRLPDGGPEDRFVYGDTRYELTCTGPGGTDSDLVDVSINTSQLLVSIDMDLYLVKAGDNFNVDVTVSNPGAQIVQNVFVNLIVPQYVIINQAALPSNATCTGACDAGETLQWDIGGVEAGTVTVVSVEPEVSLTVPGGEDIGFEVTTSADGEPDEVVTENTTEGVSDLGLGLAQTPSEPEAGDVIVYTLDYDNSGAVPLANVELTLTLPGPVAFLSANNGGTVSDGVVTWTFTELAAGANGEVEATVEVNPTIPPGAQLRAAAGASVDGTPVRARATTLGSVGDGTAECLFDEDCPVGDFCVEGECTPPLLVELVADAVPLLEGESFRVSATVTNPTTTETVNAIEVQIQVPQGVNSVPVQRISRGQNCGNSAACAVGSRISWEIGNLAPGESRVVWLEPAAMAGSAGSEILFRASASSINSTSANGEATVEVIAVRALNLRMVESANPVANGQSLTYTLHYANPSNSLISNVSLMLTAPAGTTVTDAGGGINSGGVITWDLGSLNTGEGGTRTATVTVNARAGQQLRADALVFDADAPLEQTRATVQTPVGESPFIAFVEVNPDPGRQGERTDVSVTVTNPSTSITRNNVTVELQVPEGVNSVPVQGISSGKDCGNSAACAVGSRISWRVGNLAPGESRVVSLAPIIADATVNGSLIFYQADIRENSLTPATAVEQTSVLAGGTMLVQGNRALNLRMVESANPVANGQSLTYTLHYANPSNSLISNVSLMLTAPTGTTVTDAGGGIDSGGVITWDLGSLSTGEGGTRTATVTVNAQIGQQLRAEAVVFDADAPLEQTRATVQTPVADSPLIALVEVNPDPGRQGERTDVSVTVTNPSTSITRNDVTVELQVPQGVDSVRVQGISSGQNCGNSAACAVGSRISWRVGNLAPGESRVVSLAPIIADATVNGSLIFYQADIRQDALTPATAVEQTSILAGGTMLVQGNRALNLRMVESANPVANAQSLKYTLHYANQSNSLISNVSLMLTTPTGTTVTDAGGGIDSGGVITWDLDSLSTGEVGTRTATVTVNAQTGQQLRAEAVVFDADDPLEQTRATVQTPVADSTLATSVVASVDPAQPDDIVRVTMTVENVSTSVTESSVKLQIQVPQGLDSIPVQGGIASGSSCGNSAACAVGSRISWDVGSLIPGESTGFDFWIDAPVRSDAQPGFLISFESQTLVGDGAADQRNVAGTTVAVEAAP